MNTPQPDFAGTSVELDRLLLERDFYLKLLNLGGCDDPDVFLREALSLISGLTGAEKSYIELRSTNEGEDDVCHLQFGLSEEELSAVQNQISTGIIAEALATGQTIVTPAALLDPRFSQFDSVQLGRIGAVICAPIGPSDRLGVLYLHTTRNGHTFSDADRKPVELFARHLAPLAERLLSRLALRKTDDPTAQYRKQLRADDLIGRSHALASVLHEVSLIAPLELSVLITGPTGTGKSQLAEIIHNSSRRSGGPFVVVNCATLPPALAESELFGYERGAHSTAVKDKHGKLQAAAGGTLFLDEIAELPLESQAKLLHVLQNKTYFPLGGTTPRTTDARIIAATNVSLQAHVRDGRFREDLFFRLNVMPIELPPLAQRVEDIAELAEGLVRRICEANHFPELRLARDALVSLRHAEWPGNVRELENTLTRACMRAAAQGGAAIRTGHLFPERGADTRACPTWSEATRAFQRQLLLGALTENDWNVARAARQLDLARPYVHSLIAGFGIEKPNHGSN